MRRLLYILILLALTLSPVSARQKTHVLGFYNVENLFDTSHDDGKNDYEYLPEGSNKWTPEKYRKKLHNIAGTISKMAEANGQFHAILGLAEVENEHVLRDLVAMKELAPAGFKHILVEGPDRRGVDVALLYRPDVFKVTGVKSIPFDFNSGIEFEFTPQEQKDFRTRDILRVCGTIDGEKFAVYVCHLPSRGGDKGGDLRCRGAEIVYNDAMALQKSQPGIKIIVMGDMNDDPTDESMTRYLHGREKISATTENDFFSPFLSMIKNGYGTLSYRGKWNLFDGIYVNRALAHPAKGTFGIQKIEKGRYYGKVFNADFLTNQSGPYKGTPFRTFSRGEFIGGYSDHYPTYIVIKK